MALVYDQKVIQTFFPNRADPAFSKGIGNRGLVGCEQDVNTLRLKDGIKRSAKLRITIMDEVADG